MRKIDGETISKYDIIQYKQKLETEMLKQNTTIKYLLLMKDYFIKNNITTYKKYDKRDFTKIKEYLQSKNFLYYNYCTDNIGIGDYSGTFQNKREIVLYINNDDIYNATITIFDKSIFDNNNIDFKNVLEQVEDALNYNREKLKQNKKLYKNFDKIIDKYNKKLIELNTIIENNNLNNIFDMYLYIGKDYEE